MAASLEMASQIFYNPRTVQQRANTLPVFIKIDSQLNGYINNNFSIYRMLSFLSCLSSEMNMSESFTNQSIDYYEAKPIKLLESSQENTKMINQWVANKTNNKITNLLDSVTPATQLVLVNAVTFSGQ